MTDDLDEIDRRDALRLAGGVAAASVTGLAGCTDNGGGGGGGGTPTGTENGTTGTETGNGTTGTGTENGTTGTETENGTRATAGGGGAAETIELGGKTDGWTGRRPARIEGQTNPTLRLEPGRTYKLTWVNLDGAEHELIIEDSNGQEITASESSEQKGQSVTMQFTATKEMAQYYCEYHPQSMRGDVATGGSSN